MSCTRRFFHDRRIKGRDKMFSNSVVIITKDRPREVSSLLASLRVQTRIPNEVIVVDASAKDDTQQTIEECRQQGYPAPIRFIRDAANISGQKNTGISFCAGDIITFFDDDVQPAGDYLEMILRIFEDDSRSTIAATGGLMMNPSHRSWTDVMFRKLFLLQTDRGKNKFRASGIPDQGFRFSKDTEVHFIASTALSIRRSTLGSIRFEEHWLTGANFGFPTGRGFLEDVLFTHQLRGHGMLFVTPSAKYFHYPSSRNRDATLVAQTLYVFALRYISHLLADSPMRQICRVYALSGQFLFSIIQTIALRNYGYIKGYLKAMRHPMNADGMNDD